MNQKKSLFLRTLALTGASILTVSALCNGTLAYATTSSSSDSDSDSSTFDDGQLTYKITGTTTCEITECDTAATTVSIMGEIDGYSVTAIGDEAFSECENLIGIALPESITSIGEGAFYGCSGLTEITLPNSVTEISDGMFQGCSGLTSLTLGDKVTSIGSYAFAYCSGLTEITIPETVTTMGDAPFYYCTGLTSLEIPDSVTTLGAYTLYGCYGITEFTIPKTLEDIGEMTFYECSAMANIYVEDGNPNYKVKDNVLYSADGTVLYLYPPAREDTSFVIDDEVLVVYAGAFRSASNLQEITFGAKTQYIGETAFSFSGLTGVTFSEEMQNIGELAFYHCDSLTSVTFEDDGNNDNDEDLEIDEYAFLSCDSLMDVTLPHRVSSIGDYAFGCTEDTDNNIQSNSGFLLIGYTGVAEKYAKDCDVDVSFKSINFNWKLLVFWLVICLVTVVVVILAIRIIRSNMMTPEEKQALAEAEAERKIPLSERENGDGYKSIVDDTDDTVVNMTYDETFSSFGGHNIMHATQEKKQDEEKENE